ncbi:helix-turn-helix domain-containing protein [Actinoplanes sp. NBRC 103695]|uniref:helix-turn-helix domain-containing protein n=1 Tax=Actinoplanes sp. NBRC 103695 TaxID=3032202 RepID=UPI0024A158CB|nr:helix-turn-helix domain-containing protein [Actinoplanes sp. NBRC 103695]GLZ00574.1 hypothetical protein Acsp02_78260 [Actinoplanes sp. NBRC 103695]
MTTPLRREALWDIHQTAEYLRVPVQTLYTWRKRQYGPPASRVGRHLRYDPDDVRDWFRTQRQAA